MAKIGDKRTTVRFALLPTKTTDDGWIWLKYYANHEVLGEHWYDSGSFNRNSGWMGEKWFSREKTRNIKVNL